MSLLSSLSTKLFLLLQFNLVILPILSILSIFTEAFSAIESQVNCNTPSPEAIFTPEISNKFTTACLYVNAFEYIPARSANTA